MKTKKGFNGNSPIIKVMQTKRVNGNTYGFDKNHGWLIWNKSDFGTGWIPCVPSWLSQKANT